MKIVVAALVTLIMFLVVTFFLTVKQGKKNAMVQRLESLSARAEQETDSKRVREKRNRRTFLARIRILATRWRRVHKNADLDLKMQQAGWPIFGAEFQVMVAGLSVCVGLFLFLLTFDWVFLVGGMILTFVSCLAYLNFTISNRRKAFLNQLGDTLVMVSNALRAGFSFMQAMELISREMQPPIGEEFQKVIAEVNLGATLDVALENMSQRLKCPDFDLVVTAVLIQRQVGGNLSQVLDSISDTIMERIRMRNEVLSLTAQGRFSGMIVGALPFAIAGFVKWQNPTYFQPMLDNIYGQIALVIGAVLVLVALFIIRKIVDIDV